MTFLKIFNLIAILCISSFSFAHENLQTEIENADGEMLSIETKASEIRVEKTQLEFKKALSKMMSKKFPKKWKNLWLQGAFRKINSSVALPAYKDHEPDMVCVSAHDAIKERDVYRTAVEFKRALDEYNALHKNSNLLSSDDLDTLDNILYNFSWPTTAINGAICGAIAYVGVGFLGQSFKWSQEGFKQFYNLGYMFEENQNYSNYSGIQFFMYLFLGPKNKIN